MKDAAVFAVHFSLDCLDDDQAVEFMKHLRNAAQILPLPTRMILYFNRGAVPDPPPNVCPPGCTESSDLGPHAEGESVVPMDIVVKEVRGHFYPARITLTTILPIKHIPKLADNGCYCRPRGRMEELVRKACWKILPQCSPYAPANQTILAGV